MSTGATGEGETCTMLWHTFAFLDGAKVQVFRYLTAHFLLTRLQDFIEMTETTTTTTTI